MSEMKNKSEKNIIQEWINHFNQKFKGTHNIVRDLPFFLTKELNIYLLYKKSNQEGIWIRFLENFEGFLNYHELELTLIKECNTRENSTIEQLRTLDLSENVFLIFLSPPELSNKLSKNQKRLLIFLPDNYTKEFVNHSLFDNICENKEIFYYSIKEIMAMDSQIPYRILTEIRNYQLMLLRIEQMKTLKKQIKHEITIGIITALYEELKAMINILENQGIYHIDKKSTIIN